jgi:hypothetical protein
MFEYVELFRQLLRTATNNIAPIYFQLPIATREHPIYRERVYCYELYHCLRSIWPNGYPYSLGGEVDKTGHPLFRDGPLKNVKPDILVHQPGDMAGNLIVLEVKPINADREGIEKDLISITEFRRYAGYHYGMYLIYGGTQGRIENFRNRVQRIAESEQRNRIDLGQIEMVWQSAPQTPAETINWQ